MGVSSKVLSIVLSVALAIGLMPSLAFGAGNSANDGMQESSRMVVDGLAKMGDLEAGQDVSADQTEESEPDADFGFEFDEGSGGKMVRGSLGLGYVYIEQALLPLDSAQHIVIGFTDGVVLDDASLILASSATGDRQRISLTRSVEGAALFEIASSLLSTGVYRLVSLERDGATLIDFDNEPDDYSFAVVDRIEGGAQELVEGVETNSLSVGPDGVLISTDDMEAALEEASKPSSDDISMFAAGDRSASKVPDASSPLVIVLDPGHGGYDGGAGGYGVQENIINLKIAEYCKEELEKYLFTEVYLTREDDEFVSLGDRVDFAIDHEADLVVSIHNNSSTSSSPHGSEVIVPNDSSWPYEGFHDDAEALGEVILSHLTALGLSISQGVYDRDCTNDSRYPDGSLSDYYTLIAGPREEGILGVIVEHAFVSNPSDASFLANESNLKALGVADAQAIVEHYGLRLKVPMFGFSDVFEDTPHYQEIGWLSASGVSTGFEDGTFRPIESVTRQDMAAFLYRMAGSPDYTPTASELRRFSDVDESTPHYNEILWMASAGISTGFEDGTFRPLNNVTRQDAAAFLRRLAALEFDPSVSSWTSAAEDRVAFSDVTTSTSHAEDIWWLSSAGISGGYADGTFRGLSAVTRQDMAAFLYRLNVLSDFEASDADKRSFSDVDESVSHANEIWWLASKGISKGFDDGTFRPFDAVARQDMAAFLYRLAGSPSYTPSASDKMRFSDVDDGTAHSKEILWLARTGISTGFSDGTFRPEASVAREDMAAFLRRIYDYLANNASEDWVAGSNMGGHFIDVNSSTYHAEDIWWLASMGVSLGFPDGSYGVGGSVTRGDMAAFLYRLNVNIDRAAFRAVPIMGETEADVDQFVAYFKSVGAVYPTEAYRDKGAATIEEFVQIVVDESKAEGVRAEVVFCQAMKETGWLGFGGDVEPDQCNFAGLGATGGGADGATFKDVRTGIRAQVQHLKAYASTEPLVNKCVDPRFDFVTRGCAPYLTGLNGRWAVPGTTYGQDIAAMIERLYDC